MATYEMQPDGCGRGVLRRPRSAAVAVALTVAVLAAACGEGRTDEAAPPPSPFATVETATSVPEARAAPRWEVVADLSGTTGGETAPFTIDPGAIQWRVRWTCGTGTLAMGTVPAPERGRPLVEEAPCPGQGEGFSVQSGELRLDVEASGPWQGLVEQQVETPVDEAPLAEMASAPVVAEGSFYAIEKEGEGKARLYRLADGRLALRLEGFEVTRNTDLFVWLSEAPMPATSEEAITTPFVEIAELTSTIGNQNYLVPSDLPAERIRSVVIWCEPVRVAYAASPLETGP